MTQVLLALRQSVPQSRLQVLRCCGKAQALRRQAARWPRQASCHAVKALALTVQLADQGIVAAALQLD